MLVDSAPSACCSAPCAASCWMVRPASGAGGRRKSRGEHSVADDGAPAADKRAAPLHTAPSNPGKRTHPRRSRGSRPAPPSERPPGPGSPRRAPGGAGRATGRGLRRGGGGGSTGKPGGQRGHRQDSTERSRAAQQTGCTRAEGSLLACSPRQGSTRPLQCCSTTPMRRGAQTTWSSGYPSPVSTVSSSCGERGLNGGEGGWVSAGGKRAGRRAAAQKQHSKQRSSKQRPVPGW